MATYLENEYPTDTGERYLRIYGAMQGLFLQQDALSDLIKAIHPAKEIRRHDVLKDIREIRNASGGHPTQLRRKGALSMHAIVQSSSWALSNKAGRLTRQCWHTRKSRIQRRT